MTETWLFDNDTLTSYDLPYYKLYVKCRKSPKRGDEAALYVHDNMIQFFESELPLNSISFESLTVNFHNTPLGNIIIYVVYRQPDKFNINAIEIFNEKFNQFLNTVCKPQKIL